MLQSNEYELIKNDYDQISREHFDTGYVPLRGMSFQKSDALFPPPHLAFTLSQEFEKQCQTLCFGKYPAWQQIQQCFNEIQNLL